MSSETTGVSPFYANYGFHPRMGVEPRMPPPPGLSTLQKEEYFKANEIAHRFRAVLDMVTALSWQSRDRYEEQANKKRADTVKYKVGDKVMLDMRNMKTGRPVQKLAPRWEGPFTVTKASSHAVQLALPANMKVFNTFHVQLVRPRPEHDSIPGQKDAIDDIAANDGREITRTDNGEEVEEWRFKRLLAASGRSARLR